MLAVGPDIVLVVGRETPVDVLEIGVRDNLKQGRLGLIELRIDVVSIPGSPAGPWQIVRRARNTVGAEVGRGPVHRTGDIEDDKQIGLFATVFDQVAVVGDTGGAHQ